MARTPVVIIVLLSSLTAATSASAQSVDRRPVLDVVMDNRSSPAATELAAARSRVRFIFAEAGIRLLLMTRDEFVAPASGGFDPIDLIVLGDREASGVMTGDRRRLGFAMPAARRVYVHYDRVFDLARAHGVQPGWFLGVVMAHELAHVLLPRTGHAAEGIMTASLSPDPKRPPAFSRDEATQLRERLGGETLLALK